MNRTLRVEEDRSTPSSVRSPRRTLAWLAALALLVAAGPARAGGPTQPPDGWLSGFKKQYTIPPFHLQGFLNGQCLRILCWSPSHAVRIGIEVWTAGYGTDGKRFREEITPHLPHLGIPRDRLCRLA